MKDQLVRLALSYAAGDTPLDELQQMLLQVLWEPDMDAFAIELARAIELPIAEHTSGDLTEDELKMSIYDLVAPRVVYFSAAARPSSQSETLSVTVRHAMAFA